MSTTDVRQDDVSGTASVTNVDMKVEVVVIPAADVDRAKEFHTRLGWRRDRTPPGVVQFTPQRLGVLGPVRYHPHLGRAGLGQGVPGRLRPPGHATRARRRRDRGERGERGFPSGPRRPGRRSRSRAPQLLLARHVPRSGRQPLAAAGDYDPATRPCRGRRHVVRSTSDLASAFRRAAAAHEHEKRTGEADPDWPNWYAAYMVAEQAAAELPT